MCGRIRQAGDGEQYMETLNWNPRTLFDDDKQPRYNVPPGTRPLTLHRLGDGSEQADRMFWGYKPRWYKGKDLANANITTVLGGSGLWKPLLPNRVIVPCDGWYEWSGEKPDKQPWYIHPKDGKPLLLAGIAAWAPGKDFDASHGFAIITNETAGGMKDLLHDRRPICLTADAALEWLDPDVPVEQGLDILSTARPESAFAWHPVTRAMGSSRYQLADASEPVDL